MSMPAFAAEAALYKSSAHYRAALSSTTGDRQVGLSQLGRQHSGGHR